MLREALMSVAAGRPDQVIVADDGSSFSIVNVVANALYQRCEYAIIANPECDTETRMTVPRQGALINRALTYATGDVVTSLCDDDLHDPGWYDALRAHWTLKPRTQLVRGRWLVFNDGDTPTLADPPSPMCPARKMTAGNFAWDANLTRGASPRCAWPTAQLNCLDDGFLRSLQRAGVDVFKVASVGFAGWRREHEKVNTLFSDGKNHTEAFRALLASGSME
jgi:glycosyltransferase involved in cell wall biosynthesis